MVHDPASGYNFLGSGQQKMDFNYANYVMEEQQFTQSPVSSSQPTDYVHSGLDSYNASNATDHLNNANGFDGFSSQLSQQPLNLPSPCANSIGRPAQPSSSLSRPPPPMAYGARRPQISDMYHAVGQASVSYPAHPTGCNGFPSRSLTQPSQASLPSSTASFLSPLSSSSPSISTSFLGLRMLTSQAINRPQARPFPPMFSRTQNGFPVAQRPVISPSSSARPSNLRNPINPNDRVKFSANSLIKPSPRSSPSSSSSSAFSSIKLPTSRAANPPRISPPATQLRPPSDFLPSSSVPSSQDTQLFAPPVIVRSRRQNQDIMGQDYIASQASPTSPVPSQPGSESSRTESSTLLRGEIDSNQTRFNQTNATGESTSSKARLVEPHQSHAQSTGRIPPKKQKEQPRPSTQSKSVVKKRTETDYSIEYANAQKSMPYPDGLQWVFTPQERKGGEDGPSEQSSGEKPNSQRPPSTSSTSSPPSPDRKRKREGDEESYSRPSTSSSTLQAPVWKRSKPPPKDTVEHQINIGGGWKGSTFGQV